MPAAVAQTSTFALNNATMPYTLQLANKGLEQAVAASPAVAQGVNTYKGHIVYPAVAESQGKPWKELKGLL